MIDPTQLANESAGAALMINMMLVLLTGCAGGGLIALVIVAWRAIWRCGERDWPYGN